MARPIGVVRSPYHSWNIIFVNQRTRMKMKRKQINLDLKIRMGAKEIFRVKNVSHEQAIEEIETIFRKYA